jgi:hypothetical protein
MKQKIRKWGTFQITKEITKGENMRRMGRNNKLKRDMSEECENLS